LPGNGKLNKKRGVADQPGGLVTRPLQEKKPPWGRDLKVSVKDREKKEESGGRWQKTTGKITRPGYVWG